MISEPVRVWLCIGSNHVDALGYIRQALVDLGKFVSDMLACEPYSTPALNGVDADYTNTVATGFFHGNADNLNTLCKEVENALGRTRKRTGSALHVVEIDIDVVLFGGEILRHADFSRDYFVRGFNRLKEDCPDLSL